MIVARFSEQLQAFAELPRLHARVIVVLGALPEPVQTDFIEDPSFRITLEDFTPGKGWKLFMACPTASGMVSRCVVLRRKLNEAPEPFTDYVIAHEFAHAFLRNGGWGDIQDIEEAADALAASWGFTRPDRSAFFPWRKS
jgi:hypothetical protein